VIFSVFPAALRVAHHNQPTLRRKRAAQQLRAWRLELLVDAASSRRVRAVDHYRRLVREAEHVSQWVAPHRAGCMQQSGGVRGWYVYTTRQHIYPLHFMRVLPPPSGLP
jgi:hypothetical protein